MTQSAAAIDFPLSDAASLGNAMLDRLAAMRAIDPIFRSEANGGIWMVNGHKEVSDAFAGRKPLSAVRLPHVVMGQIPPDEHARRAPYLLASTPHWVVNMDPPGQRRLRSLAQKAFGPAIAESVRPRVERFIDDAFAAAEAAGPCDFVETVARRIPGRTILELLGLPESTYPKLHEWSNTLSAALAGFHPPAEIVERAEAVLLEMRAMFLPQIEQRRHAPVGDFISALVVAQEADGDRLSDEEMLALLYLTLIAGHDTTTNTIALGTAALAGLPEARVYMRDHPAKIGDAVMELMRHVAMSTMQARIAAEDFDWNGHAIRKGEFVLLMVAGANRDPAIFPNPNHLDVTRPQTGNMTFGPGLHFCIGHNLARMQANAYFAALVQRYDPEFLDPRLNFGPSLSFRGVTSMHVALHPRTPAKEAGQPRGVLVGS